MNTQDKHTPGPWHNERPQPDSRSASAVICGAPPSCIPHIAYIPTNGYAATLDEQAANARLIAAAPEMKNVLNAVLHQMEHGEASDALDVTRHAFTINDGIQRDLCWCRDQIKSVLKTIS